MRLPFFIIELNPLQQRGFSIRRELLLFEADKPILHSLATGKSRYINCSDVENTDNLVCDVTIIDKFSTPDEEDAGTVEAKSGIADSQASVESLAKSVEETSLLETDSTNNVNSSEDIPFRAVKPDALMENAVRVRLLASRDIEKKEELYYPYNTEKQSLDSKTSNYQAINKPKGWLRDCLLLAADLARPKQNPQSKIRYQIEPYMPEECEICHKLIDCGAGPHRMKRHIDTHNKILSAKTGKLLMPPELQKQ